MEDRVVRRLGEGLVGERQRPGVVARPEALPRRGQGVLRRIDGAWLGRRLQYGDRLAVIICCCCRGDRRLPGVGRDRHGLLDDGRLGDGRIIGVGVVLIEPGGRDALQPPG